VRQLKSGEAIFSVSWPSQGVSYGDPVPGMGGYTPADADWIGHAPWQGTPESGT